MKTILVSYRDHTEPFAGGAVHGYHVVEQLRRLGYRLVTAEPKTDARLERYPHTVRGMRALLDVADAVYLRCDARPWDMSLLALNRVTVKRPVVTEINAIAEERLAFGTDLLAHAETRWRRSAYHTVVRLSDAAVCVSNALARHVAATYPIESHRVFVAPNGGTPLPDRGASGRNGRFRIVWAGGARWPWQGLDLVVEGFERLRKRVPTAELVLFADAAPTTLGDAGGVVVKGPVAHRELGAVLSQMDAALCLYRPMPHSPAGFYNSPLKLFDYMAAALPIVGSRLGQIAEVIEDGVSGILVGDDPDEVALRLEELAASPERRTELGTRALGRLVAGYTWHHTGDAIGRILDDLLREQGRSGPA